LPLQVRDEYRVDYDEGRGGYGNIMAQATQRQLAQMQEYEAGQEFHGEGEGDHDMGIAKEAPVANPRFRAEDSDEE